MVAKALLSSKTDEWETPQDLFDRLDEEFCFGVDVCATEDNAKCLVYLGPGARAKHFRDGLGCQWSTISANWMNPPYSNIRAWVQKAWDESERGATVVCLVPARVDTKWWSIFWDHDNHRPRRGKDQVRFIKGRLKFVGAEHSAPFPSAIVVLRGSR